MNTKKTVAVVEDDRRLREKLVQVLENIKDIECIATCSSRRSVEGHTASPAGCGVDGHQAARHVWYPMRGRAQKNLAQNCRSSW